MCLKFKKRLRNHEVKKPKLPKKGKTSQRNIQLYEPLTVEDIREAEHEIIKYVQRVSFKEEVDTLKPRKADKDTPDHRVTKKQSKVLKATSSVYRLDPFLDDDGVMRVGGRIRKASCAEDVKHLVILPRKHHITELVVRHCHQQTQHQALAKGSPRASATIYILRSRLLWTMVSQRGSEGVEEIWWAIHLYGFTISPYRDSKLSRD